MRLGIGMEDNRMTEQDERAVECMCMCGVCLEGLFQCFPNFSRDELERVYEHVNLERDAAGYKQRIA